MENFRKRISRIFLRYFAGIFCGFFAVCFSVLFIFSALIFFPCAASAEGTENSPIRVGYNSSGSMLYRDSEGRFQGYDAVFLYEIARYTGWTYAFVPYDDWSQAVADLAAGKIDILPTVLKTPEREQQMNFSLYPMAQTSVGVLKRPDDTRFVYGELSTIDGMRIGVRSGTADTKDFMAWMERHGLQGTLVPYRSRGDLLTALKAGMVDLAATSYAGDAQKFPLLAEFSPQAMYFATPKTRPEIGSELDRAMGNILLYNSGFRDALDHLDRPARDRYRIFFSDSEAEFLKSVPTLRVALYRDHAPYSYEREDGTAGGMTVRVLERIADITGLSFEYVFVGSLEEVLEKMKSHDIDVLGFMYTNLPVAEDEGLRLTTPYYDGDLARISRSGGTGKETAVPRSLHFLFEGKRAQETDERLVVYDSTQQAIEAFTAGQVDAVYCDAATAGYLVNVLKRGGTDMQLRAGTPAHIGMAMTKDADLRLGLVLDRTIQYLDDVEMDEIEQREINEAPMTFGNVLDHLTTLQTYALFLVLLVLMVGAAYFAFVLYRQRGMERRTLRIAILHLLIPALGGEWEIHSTAEKGTEVTVEFLVDATGK
ncbi:MAG: transporter substrate-binding domain-containing protein [Selenomonadaceae bacterium]|nr:transporter substrate-binding domain-containing protein [Selenomonadaceae bacterium]